MIRHESPRRWRRRWRPSDDGSSGRWHSPGQTGEFAPLHCTAHGKVLLADYDLYAMRELLGRAPLHAYTRRTLKSVARLARACAEARIGGFAIDDGEYIEEDETEPHRAGPIHAEHVSRRRSV